MNKLLLALGNVVFPSVILCGGIGAAILLRSVKLEDEIPPPLRPVVGLALVLLLISVIGVFSFVIFDIIHASRNARLSNRDRVAWICALWFLNVFVIPIYWYRHLHRQNKE
jgi:hypothetical protein